MSWSVSAVGKTKAVAESIEKQFAQSSCSEPEESVRQSARLSIAAALGATREDGVVQVTASGSQSGTYTEGVWGPPWTNQLEIKIQPMGYFLE